MSLQETHQNHSESYQGEVTHLTRAIPSPHIIWTFELLSEGGLGSHDCHDRRRPSGREAPHAFVDLEGMSAAWISCVGMFRPIYQCLLVGHWCHTHGGWYLELVQLGGSLHRSTLLVYGHR